MIFKKKKKKDGEEAVLNDTSGKFADELTGEELEADEEMKEILDEDTELKDEKDPEAIAKYLIFEIEHGCPICGSDVKGNDFYRYYCEQCNVLFERKDILEKEFGKSLGEVSVGVKKTRLTPDEKKELDKKRKELQDRIFSTFSDEQKKEIIAEEEEKEDEPVKEEAPTPIPKVSEEPVAEHEEPVEAEQDEIAEEVDDENSAVGMEDVISALGTPRVQEAEFEESNHEEPEEEYELEPGKIIASSQSDKLHEGSCHFVKKIHPENRIYFDSIEKGEEEGYEPCVCIRRIIAKQKTGK